MRAVRREVMRVLHQIADLATDLPERLIAARVDRAFPVGLTVTEGTVAPGPKLALLLIWQPAGLAASTLHTCRHLIARGYAPMVVSNAGLSQGDRAALAATAWKVVERPNRGHDFGGYRDGIRLLGLWGVAPKRLLVLNDSVWFPLREDDGLIARIEALEAPFAGASVERKAGREHRAHLQSFFYLLGAGVLRSPAFATYWHGYLASSNRRKVLARGEKGFSAAMVSQGFALAAPQSRAGLRAAVNAFDAADLRQALAYAADPDPRRMAERQAILSLPGPAFVSAARVHIDTVLEGGSYAEAFPLATARAFGLSFLKKRMEPLSLAARRQVLRAIDAGDLAPPAAVVHDEMRQATPPATPEGR